MKQTTRFALMAAACAILFYTACTKQDAPSNTDQTSPRAATAKSGPISVMYVEVNNNNLLNVGCYSLKKSGAPFFDYAIIFAANINYDATAHKAVLYNNPNVTKVLTNKATYIQPLQAKGIKVTLSILGNHQGAGIGNFTSRAAAADFAQQLAIAVNTYGLDGIDFDDEYADYGNNGLPQPNDSSLILLLSELRSRIPGKTISIYNIGVAASYGSYGGHTIGEYANYAWNPYYSTYSVPATPGLTNAQKGPAAVDVTSTSSSTSTSFAQRTVSDGYGVMLFYNLTQTSIAGYLQGTSKALYNDSVVAQAGCSQPWTSQ